MRMNHACMSEFMDIGRARPYAVSRAIAQITNAVGSCGSATGAEQLTFDALKEDF